MLGYFFGDNKTAPLDAQIEAILNEMESIGVNAEEYPAMMNNLDRLTEIRKKQRPGSVSPDTIAIVVGNLMGILLIIAYEQKHVMTSKGFSQLIRPR